MRTRTYLILMTLISPISLAETLQDKLLICAQNSDSLQRLVCYDKLTESLKVKEVKEQYIQSPRINQNSAQQTTEPKVVAKSVAVAVKTQPVESQEVKINQAARKAVAQEEAALAKFGHEDKQVPEELIERIQAKVSKLSKSVYGQYIITLDNQQVWRQTDKTRMKLSKGQNIDIERGLMGSFFMGTEQVNKRIRVKRVK